MARKPIEIGHVVRLSGEVTGFVVNVTRYGNGRLLPAPRILMSTDGKPFASALAALDALALWKGAGKPHRQGSPAAKVRFLHKGDVVAAPVAPAPKPVLRVAREAERAPTTAVSDNLTGKPKISRKIKRAVAAPKPALPEVRKLLPERPTQIIRDRRTKTQALIDSLLAAGQATVTRYEEYQSRRNYVPKHGGVLPGHLNPVTIL